MSNAVLDIQHVSHRYGSRPALQDVSLTVANGATLALLGPNGSGKTTLFRIITTLIRPESGSVFVGGFDVRTRPSDARRQLGVVFQDVALDADLTVRENLRHHAALHGMTGAPVREAAGETLRALGLQDRAHDRVKTLSGGLARRADLARVLMHRPRILLLDEPTSGLDPTARRDFWDALRRLRTAQGTTVVVATHLLDEAEQCERVCIMSEGRVVAEDSPEALKSALGQETLWIEALDPAEFADRIHAQFGVESRVMEDGIHIAHAQAHNLLARIYEAFSDRITSATVRRPTLEDVYMVHTGHGLGSVESSPAPGGRQPEIHHS